MNRRRGEAKSYNGGFTQSIVAHLKNIQAHHFYDQTKVESYKWHTYYQAKKVNNELLKKKNDLVMEIAIKRSKFKAECQQRKDFSDNLILIQEREIVAQAQAKKNELAMVKIQTMQ